MLSFDEYKRWPWKWKRLNCDYTDMVYTYALRYKKIQQNEDAMYQKETRVYFKSHIWKELTEYVFNPIRLFTMAEKFGYDLAEYIELI
jgi:CMP-N-acetylneuraminic acid synthetase